MTAGFIAEKLTEAGDDGLGAVLNAFRHFYASVEDCHILETDAC